MAVIKTEHNKNILSLSGISYLNIKFSCDSNKYSPSSLL